MSSRRCAVCSGTGWLYQTPDSQSSAYRDGMTGYNEMKCWRCVGTGFVYENPASPLNKQEESVGDAQPEAEETKDYTQDY